VAKNYVEGANPESAVSDGAYTMSQRDTMKAKGDLRIGTLGTWADITPIVD
jgi:hypothetical protein